jgi:hypothetical protein
MCYVLRGYVNIKFYVTLGILIQDCVVAPDIVQHVTLRDNELLWFETSMSR